MPPESDDGHARAKPSSPKRAKRAVASRRATSGAYARDLGAERGVAEDASPRQEQVALRLERDEPGAPVGDDIADRRGSPRRHRQPGEDPQQRRLPASARADDGDELTGGDVGIERGDRLDRDVTAVRVPDVAQRDRSAAVHFGKKSFV